MLFVVRACVLDLQFNRQQFPGPFHSSDRPILVGSTVKTGSNGSFKQAAHLCSSEQSPAALGLIQAHDLEVYAFKGKEFY